MKQFGITARDAGLAWVANQNVCGHVDRVPVEIATGETVAALCADCLLELPQNWLCN